jgi:uroporphyrinogen decarboxylase
MSKRQFIFNVFDGKKEDKVPVGFWFHFAPGNFTNPSTETVRKNIEGHQNFFNEFSPDFLKLMSDGYFLYPNETVAAIKTPKDLDKVKAGIPLNWIDEQVALVKELTKRFKNEVASFYNIFSVPFYLEIALQENGSGLNLSKLVKENPKGLKHALEEIAKDISVLISRVITEGGADGIYLSVKNIQGVPLSPTEYLNIVGVAEKSLLAAANAKSKYNILHICGYEGARNNLLIYQDYDAKVINFASTVEGISLSAGKEIFKGKTIIGGFGNTDKDVLFKGTKEEIVAETKRLISENGKEGIILGADCTVPWTIDLNHLKWVREAANS